MSSTQLMARLHCKSELMSFLFKPVVFKLGDFVPVGIFGNVWRHLCLSTVDRGHYS